MSSVALWGAEVFVALPLAFSQARMAALPDATSPAYTEHPPGTIHVFTFAPGLRQCVRWREPLPPAYDVNQQALVMLRYSMPGAATGVLAIETFGDRAVAHTACHESVPPPGLGPHVLSCPVRPALVDQGTALELFVCRTAVQTTSSPALGALVLHEAMLWYRAKGMP